jgi:putative ABC transport system substrate-binding protein
MTRRIIGLLLTLGLGLLVAPLAAAAQPPGPLPRLAVLSPGDAAALTGRGLQAFFNGLRDLGYVDGQTILVEYRHADWQLDQLPALAVELVRLKPDVLFTYTDSGNDLCVIRT